MSLQPLLIILGPTASGKTKLAVSLAGDLNGELISADSRQVYKGMDIGTGKDIQEYQLEGRSIPYHLIDIRNAGEKYNVNDFKDDFFAAFEEITSRTCLPILCGGTGMYIHSLLQQQDFTSVPVNAQLREQLHNYDIFHLRKILSDLPEHLVKHADHSSHKRLIRAIEIAVYLQKHPLVIKDRPAFSPLVIGLTSNVAHRRERIYLRLEQRLASGLIEEVQHLLTSGVPATTLEYYGLEYGFVSRYIHGQLTLSELKERLATGIYQYAKRQMTFFRKMEKDGVLINWYDSGTPHEEIKSSIIEMLEARF